jgi:small GTP-binding protein
VKNLSTEKPEYLFKVSVVGDGSVGKTSTIRRYTTNTFRENYIPTLGVGFARKKVDLDNRKATLQIWDLGGQESLGNVRANFYEGSFGVIFMFDVTRHETFEALIDWKREVDSNLDKYAILVLGNKTDLVNQRTVSAKEGALVTKKIGGEYLEISAKLGHNIEESFTIITKRMIENMQYI